MWGKGAYFFDGQGGDYGRKAVKGSWNPYLDQLGRTKIPRREEILSKA